MKVLIIHASAGAGHRKAAEALYHSFCQSLPEKTDVCKIDALDYTNAFFKSAYPAIYIFLVTHIPFLWGIFFHILNYRSLNKVINWFRHFFNMLHGRPLIDYVLRQNPDVVICEHFFSAELVSHLKKQGQFRGQVVCGVTDFGVHQFWINEGTDYYLVASSITKDEILRKGVASDKVIITGIPIEEKFSRTLGKEKTRRALGILPHTLTVLVTSGGFGVGPIEKIVHCLDSRFTEVSIIVICGKNEKLYRLLKTRFFVNDVKVFGYVHNMDEFMEAADLIVSKSGGLTVSESLAKGLPMIIMKPIPGQETRNAEIIETYKIGVRLTDINTVAEHIERFLKNEQRLLNEMRENAKKLARPYAAQRICQWVMETWLSKN